MSALDDLFDGPHYPAHDFFEMELLGDHMMMLGVPTTASQELKKNVLAALKAANMGFKSIDYVKKRYGERWTFPEPESAEFELITHLRLINEEVRLAVHALSNDIERPAHEGEIAAEVALIRLRSSFHSAILLLRQGYPYEAAAICRLILEQMSWAYAVAKYMQAPEILSTEAQSTIGHFKAFYPAAGRFYGALSSASHMTPSENRHYIASEGEATVIRFVLPEMTKVVLYYALVLTDLYIKLLTELSGPYMTPRPSWADRWRKPRRPGDTPIGPYLKGVRESLGGNYKDF